MFVDVGTPVESLVRITGYVPLFVVPLSAYAAMPGADTPPCFIVSFACASNSACVAGSYV